MKKHEGEFEIINYPRIDNINIFFVNLINRTPHIHRDMEFCFIMNGKMLIKLKDREIVARGGSLYFFNSNEPHSLKRMEGPSTILSLQISSKFCRQFFPEFENIYFLQGDIFEKIDRKTQQIIKEDLFRIAYQYFKGGFGFQLPLLASIYTLFSGMLKEIEYKILDKEALMRNRERHMRLSRITEYINDNLSEKITLKDIAERENLSPTYISHFFRDNLDITFQEYLSNKRFEKAEKLMAHTNFTILDICMESGFSDRKYMNKAFIRNCGCLPKVYRNKLNNKNDFQNNKRDDVTSLTNEYIYHNNKEISNLIERLRSIIFVSR